MIDIAALKPGEVIRHVGDRNLLIVTGGYGGRATAVRTYDITNPDEWELVVTYGRHVYDAEG